MSAEQLEAALKDESAEGLRGHWKIETTSANRWWLCLREDILALIEKKQKEAHEFCARCNTDFTQPRPLTLDDWKQPDILQRVVRRDGEPHEIDRVVATDMRGNYPLLLESKDGRTWQYALSGRFDHCKETSIDLLLPPRKLKRRTLYVPRDWWALQNKPLVEDTPNGHSTRPVTLIYEDTP